jgi:hypothetical protein
MSVNLAIFKLGPKVVKSLSNILAIEASFAVRLFDFIFLLNINKGTHSAEPLSQRGYDRGRKADSFYSALIWRRPPGPAQKFNFLFEGRFGQFPGHQIVSGEGLFSTTVIGRLKSAFREIGARY